MNSIEVDGADALVIFVFQRGFRVRCSSRDGSVTGLYSATHGRSVVEQLLVRVGELRHTNWNGAVLSMRERMEQT
jgi:hypothetical protein